MKIVLVANWFSEHMGYSENALPKAMAALGHEVHLITSTAQIYFNNPIYDATYKNYLGPAIQPAGKKQIDGYTLHRLPLENPRQLKICGLVEEIRRIQPDVVQTFDIEGFNAYPLAVASASLSFKFFTEMHVHASVCPGYKQRNLYNKLKWYLRLGRFLPRINQATVFCYPISDDCAEIASIVYKVPEAKIKVQSLGTDTTLFRPCSLAEDYVSRAKLRAMLGFLETDIVCIYTGRISSDKGPSILAQAIQELQSRGHTHFRGLFIGTGPQSEVDLIKSTHGCVVHDFVHAVELPSFYRAADIAVWPLQESTSQLDAMASGLPLILNDSVSVIDRIEGNGFLYKKNNALDLADRLLDLEDPKIRADLGRVGSEKAQESYSWLAIAQQRISDYDVALAAS